MPKLDSCNNAAWQNGTAERWVETCKRELIDRVDLGKLCTRDPEGSEGL